MDRIKTNRKVATAIALAVLFIMLWAIVSFTLAVVITVLLALLLLKADLALPLTASLALLVTAAILLSTGQKSGAVILANWSYYLLSIGIALLVVGFIRSNLKRSAEGEDELRDSD